MNRDSIPPVLVLLLRWNPPDIHTRARSLSRCKVIALWTFSGTSSRRTESGTLILWPGGWEKALLAVGLKLQLRKKWTKTTVIQAIQARHRQGLPLIRVFKHDKALHAAASRHFGGWHNALEAAGIIAEVHHVPANKKWDKQRIIEIIRDRHQEGKPLTYMEVRTDHAALVFAAKRHFEGWTGALTAAGLVPQLRRPRRRAE